MYIPLLFADEKNISLYDIGIIFLQYCAAPIAVAVAGWFLYRRTTNANIDKTKSDANKNDADAEKTKSEALVLTTSSLLDVLQKFRDSQELYFKLKQDFADSVQEYEDKLEVLQTEHDKFKIAVQQLILLLEVLLIDDTEHPNIVLQVANIRKQFYTELDTKIVT